MLRCFFSSLHSIDVIATPVSRRNYLHKNRDELRGDLLLVRSFRARGTDCIIDVYMSLIPVLSKDPSKVLKAHENEKKRKYLASCLEQRRHFTPFVVSNDGLIGKSMVPVCRYYRLVTFLLVSVSGPFGPWRRIYQRSKRRNELT
jgi:hypothetical protein